MSRVESEALLSAFLAYLRRDVRIRLGLGLALLAILAALAVRFLLGVVPHHYALRITGGDIVDNKHYLARVLAREAPKHGVELVVKPEEQAPIEAVSRGDVDLGFVEGGLDRTYPNVEHVALVTTEVVHLLVRPDVQRMTDLKGRTLNLGVKDTALHTIARTILAFAGYKHGIDYVETNYVPEELLALPARKMPDAVFVLSSVPSYLAEALIKDRGYRLLEISFPEALALRYGWAGAARIPAYSYDLTPAVPDKDIGTVAVNVYLVANAKTDPAGIEKVLETLYSPDVATTTRLAFDDSKLATPSGFPLSPAVSLYKARNDSVFTPAMWSKVQGVFGLIMTFSGIAIVLVKWFRGPPAKVAYDDAEFLGYIETVAMVEGELTEIERQAPVDAQKLAACRDTINELRAKVLGRYAKARFKDAAVFEHCIASVRACHGRVHELAERARS